MIFVALILCPLLAAAQEKGGPPTPPVAPAAAPQESAPATPQPEGVFKTLIKSVSLDGQIRLRAEYRDPTSYQNVDAQTRSDDQFLTRIRLNFNFAVTEDIDVFVQPQSDILWGQEASVVTDERNLDLHQGFVEIRNIFGEPITAKGGRMEMSYGDQRLVSPLDWSNVGRAFDGMKLKYGPKDWWIEGFYTVVRDPLAPVPAPFSPAATAVNGAKEDQDFMGAYFSYVGVPNYTFDAYAFFRQFQDNSFTAVPGGPPGDLVDHTVGARIKGAEWGFDYTAEAMAQNGRLSNERTQAYAYVATLGYTADVSWKPRLGVEYDFASGDRHPGNGKHGTFDPLYPYNHYYQGFADIISFKNSRDLSVYLKVQPAEPVSLHLDFHNFWLVSVRDNWYTDNGTVMRAGDPTGQASTRLGYETDAHVKITANKYLKFWAGWSHFFAGTYVRQTATAGTDTDMNWFFAQMVVDF